MTSAPSPSPPPWPPRYSLHSSRLQLSVSQAQSVPDTAPSFPVTLKNGLGGGCGTGKVALTIYYYYSGPKPGIDWKRKSNGAKQHECCR